MVVAVTVVLVVVELARPPRKAEQNEAAVGQARSLLAFIG